MLIRELIEIKEHVSRDDFVLKLTEGVVDARKTLADYVVTTDLVGNFDAALSFIRGALESRKSRGTYLHGSFGSGKSHFMAVLNLLLKGNSDARALPRLAPVVTKHDPWLTGKKFLMVPYHMIGARTLEDRIFGGYVDWVEKHHPEAPVPALFRSQPILENAATLRQRLGDVAFFDALNQGRTAGDGWGDLSGGWTAENYEDAASDPTSEDHRTLVSDLVQHLITSVKHDGDYLDLDKGLAVLSSHATDLGYDAVILFLDELVLWLASRSGDVNFLNQEVNKLAKLVEAQEMRRPIPIISFIARQRDLSELVGESVAGATSLNFLDQLRYFQGRFEMIKLGDNNLPEIVAERLLKPKNAEARALIDAEFERTVNVREEVRQVLLTTRSDPAAFRKLYPFSPALVETLVAVSSVLQRERTALKIMLQLLVEQRDTLQLGELVPVGDLYDQIAQGDDAFSSEMKARFKTADTIYRQHLKPMIEESHGLTFAEAETFPVTDPKRVALRNDDRLIKTILLAALTPEVESLRGLTPARLAALNHGTIKSPIPGGENSLVLNRLNEWRSRVGQLKLDDSTPPIVSIQLTGVDVDRILSKVENEDNFGNGLRIVKETLYQALDLPNEDQPWVDHNFRWRGTDRRCKIAFKNVREADTGTLVAEGDQWKLIIDYPLDADPNKSPGSDLARLAEFRETQSSMRTLVWVPSFFSEPVKRDLGKLVKLEKILAPHAFEGYVNDLSLQDRTSAKSILMNQRDALRVTMVTYLQVAYGLREDRSNIIDPQRQHATMADHFQSLETGLQLQVPSESHLNSAMQALLDQAMSYQYPHHPRFEDVVRLSAPYVQRVLDAFEGALQENEGRFEVEKSNRENIRMIANPLKIGEMAATHFVPGEHWKDLIRRKASGGDLNEVTVGEIREWIDWGLPPILENLIILACAAQLNCSFVRNGAPHQPTLKDLPDECRLKPQALPPQEAWNAALTLQQELLGLSDLPKLLTARALDDFSTKVKAKATTLEEDVSRLVSKLETEAGAQRLDEFDRLVSAREAQRFLKLIKQKQSADLVKAMAAFTHDQPHEGLSRSMSTANDVASVLPLNSQILETALTLPSPYKEKAEELKTQLLEALLRNEYVTKLKEVAESVDKNALKVIREQLAQQQSAPVNDPPLENDIETTETITPNDVVPIRRKVVRVEGDPLPAWLPEELAASILAVQQVQSPNGSDPATVVVTPTLKAILTRCPDARIDMEKGMLFIPSYGIEQRITVEEASNS